jgi:hypothetical protein
MSGRSTARWLVALALVAGCGSSTSKVEPPEASIKATVLRGVGQIRVMHDRRKLHAELIRIVASLRRSRAANAAGRQARRLAIQGFESTLQGTRSQLDFSENDSGNIEAATRDAKRADRYLKLGANRLRAAAQALGIRIGELNQY